MTQLTKSMFFEKKERDLRKLPRIFKEKKLSANFSALLTERSIHEKVMYLVGYR